MKEGDTVLLIRPPLVGAGFAACLLTVLNYLRHCDREGLIPVVDIDATCETQFLDPECGGNVWEQYFEPVGPWSSAELRRLLADPAHGDSAPQLRHADPSLPEWIRAPPDSIFTWIFAHWREDPPEDLPSWFTEQRRKGRETVRRHVRPKPHILEKVDRFFEAELKGRPVLGVHMRGTDLHYAPPVSPAEYFDPIEKYLEKQDDARIFLATDQIQYLELLEKRYPGIVVSTECLRSADATAPFEMQASTPYRKGEEVLIDILLLSRCDRLVRGASNIPEMAIYFADELDSLDLSLGRRFALGQDYVEGWSPLASRPAWDILKERNLEEIPDDAASQSPRQLLVWRMRRFGATLRRPWRRLRRRLRTRGLLRHRR